MSKQFALSSLCALSMTLMTAQAAEPPTSLDKPEGRLDIIAGRATSNVDRPINNMIGSRSLKKRPAARSMLKQRPLLMKWSA